MSMMEKMGIKRFLVLSILTIALIPILACIYVGNLFFTRGLECIISFDLNMAISRKASFLEEKSMTGIQTASSYEAIPGDIKKYFEYPLKDNVIYDYDTFISNNPNENYTIYLLYRNINGQPYYAWQTVPENDADMFLWPMHRDLIFTLLAVNVFIILIIYIAIRILVAKLSNPAGKLAFWASSLSQKDINAPLPDFTYPELNNIAKLLKENLHNEYRVIAKEEDFLKNCSHELRTPVTTIRVSAQLLLKQINSNHRSIERELITLNRINNAAENISNLVVTMLWLSRKKGLDPVKKYINLAYFIREIVDSIVQSNAILRGHNENTIECQLSDFWLHMPVEAGRIILENLIRNALRFSPNGAVNIIQAVSKVEISNVVDEAYACEDGFGLGVELVRRLVQKLGWQYHYENNQNIYKVTLVLGKGCGFH